MKNIAIVLFFILLSGCFSKEKEEHVSVIEKERIIEHKSIVHSHEKENIEMTPEEEVLSAAINYVVDLRKDFVENGNVDLLIIDHDISHWRAIDCDFLKESLGEIISEDLLNKYCKGKKNHDDEQKKYKLVRPIQYLKVRKLSLKYNYEIGRNSISKCKYDWVREKQEQSLFERCYFKKPKVSVLCPPVFSDKGDEAIVFLDFEYDPLKHDGSYLPSFFEANTLLLKKVKNKWIIIFYKAGIKVRPSETEG